MLNLSENGNYNPALGCINANPKRFPGVQVMEILQLTALEAAGIRYYGCNVNSY